MQRPVIVAPGARGRADACLAFLRLRAAEANLAQLKQTSPWRRTRARAPASLKVSDSALTDRLSTSSMFSGSTVSLAPESPVGALLGSRRSMATLPARTSATRTHTHPQTAQISDMRTHGAASAIRAG